MLLESMQSHRRFFFTRRLFQKFCWQVLELKSRCKTPMK